MAVSSESSTAADFPLEGGGAITVPREMKQSADLDLGSILDKAEESEEISKATSRPTRAC
jgi:hypothetical protein